MCFFDKILIFDYNVSRGTLYCLIFIHKSDISEDLTPSILDACPIVSGRTFINICLLSLERLAIIL